MSLTRWHVLRNKMDPKSSSFLFLFFTISDLTLATCNNGNQILKKMTTLADRSSFSLSKNAHKPRRSVSQLFSGIIYFQTRIRMLGCVQQQRKTSPASDGPHYIGTCVTHVTISVAYTHTLFSLCISLRSLMRPSRVTSYYTPSPLPLFFKFI